MLPMSAADVLYYVGVYNFKEALTSTDVPGVYQLTTNYLFDTDFSGSITDLDCKIYTLNDDYTKTYHNILDCDIQEGLVWIDTEGIETDDVIYIDGYYSKKPYDERLLRELLLFRTLYNIANEELYGLGTLQFDEHGWIVNGESYTIGNITVTKANLQSITTYYSNILKTATNNFELRLNRIRSVFETSHNTGDYWSEHYDRSRWSS